ncbi:MAG TPA: DUF1206 domain-containing protein [Longimicrobiales bacterium]
MDRKAAIQAFARFGLAAKGVVYLLIGALAISAAMGSARAGDSHDAIGSLQDQPLGKVMVGVIGIGLLCYSLWRLYSGIANPDDEKPGKRFMYVFTGLINLAVALEAIRVAFMSAQANTGNKAPHWTAELMSQPFGVWLVAAAGAGVAGYGLAQLVRAFRSKLDKFLRLGELSGNTRTWVRGLARIGMAARGVVFGVAGAFLIKAALENDPSEARDLGASLQAMEQPPFGTWVLGGIALGLLLYGLYNLVRARYRVIQT